MEGMGKAALWKRRIAGWKASGLASEAYCADKAYTAGGLRHWAYRLRREQQSKREEPVMRLGRVLRRAATVEQGSPTVPGAAKRERAEGIVIELAAARVAVAPGFDRSTLAAVLDVLATRGGGP